MADTLGLGSNFLNEMRVQVPLLVKISKQFLLEK